MKTMTIGQVMKELQEALNAGASESTPCFNAIFFDHNKYEVLSVVLNPVGKEDFELLFSADETERWQARIEEIAQEQAQQAQQQSVFDITAKMD